jgi:hypothetical protein
MKILGVVIAVMALVIGIVPQFTNCAYGTSASGSGMAATMKMEPAAATATTAMGQMTGMQSTTSPTAASSTKASSSTAKPKCFYSARAEIALAVPLFAIGVLLFFSRRKETRRSLSIVGIIEGLFVILIPAALVGVCMSSTMKCRTTMEPVLYATGGVVIAASIAALVWNELSRSS